MLEGGGFAGLGQGVGGVMRRHWVVVSPLATLRETLQLMRMARLRQLLVVADGILRGTLSYRALVEAVLEGRATRVAEVMAAETETGEAQMPLAEAAARIARSSTGCLPVVEPGPDGPRLVGLVTEADLLRLAYAPPRAPGS
jgi:CBS domain-containing protein